MSKLKKDIEHIVSIERLIEKYQHHPNMQGVKILKDRLKQEKLNDQIFYQSIKEKIAARQ